MSEVAHGCELRDEDENLTWQAQEGGVHLGS
jgi:hypothetical protein